MAQDKKGVVIYVDWKNTFEELTDEEAGRLIKHLFRYVSDENPEPPDRITKLLFEPIKAVLKRDLKKYEDKKAKNKANIEKRWNKENTVVYDRTNNDTNHTDRVKDIGKSNSKSNNIPKGIERENIPAPEIEISYFVPIEIMEMYMNSDVKWLETISMQNKWTIEQSKAKVKEYVEKLRAENIKEKRKDDVFRYFSNWINTQNNGQKFNKSSKTGIKESEYDGSYAKKRPITSAI